MGKMRWLVTLMALSVCAYCTFAHEPQQDRMEYDDAVMLVDHQAERDDSRVDEDGTADRGEDRPIDDGLIDHNNDNDDNDEDRQAELQSTVNSWNTIPSKYGSTIITFQHISTSINYFWGTDRSNKVYRCARPCTRGSSWVQVAGASLKQVDVSDMEVWGVSSANRVCKRPADGTGTWTEVRGQQLVHVSASGNGYIWGVSSSRYVYRCKKPCSGTWNKVHYSYGFKQVDGGEEYVFGVTTTNKVYRYPVNGGSYGRWSYIRGKYMKYVSVGANDVFGVEASSSKVYRCALPCTTGSWIIINTCQNMKQVEATVGKMVGTSADGRIFKTPV